MKIAFFVLFAGWSAGVSSFADGWTGMCVKDTSQGVRVTCVCPAGPAESAGIRVGDILESMNNQRVDSARGLAAFTRAARPAERLSVVVQREEMPQAFSLIVERPLKQRTLIRWTSNSFQRAHLANLSR